MLFSNTKIFVCGKRFPTFLCWQGGEENEFTIPFFIHGSPDISKYVSFWNDLVCSRNFFALILFHHTEIKQILFSPFSAYDKISQQILVSKWHPWTFCCPEKDSLHIIKRGNISPLPPIPPFCCQFPVIIQFFKSNSSINPWDTTYILSKKKHPDHSKNPPQATLPENPPAVSQDTPTPPPSQWCLEFLLLFFF